MTPSTRPWPVTLTRGSLTLRPLSPRDAAAWREVRRRNADWLQPWEATVPPGGEERPPSFGSMARNLRRRAREGGCLPFAIEVDGEFAGQVNVNNIVWGSARFASLGYWLDSAHAGRGFMPLAVAMVIDHCFQVVGLHRIEISIRPENTNSLRVVEKLGLREVGFSPGYLHIDGAWRDHRHFAVTAEECPEGLVTRLERRADESR